MAGKKEAKDKESAPAITPLKDATFVRIFADVSLCVNLPHGVEIALFQRTSMYKDVVMGDLYPMQVSQGRVLSDVARLRMDDDDATALAFNILLTIAESGIFDLEAFEKNVAFIRDTIKAQAESK